MGVSFYTKIPISWQFCCQQTSELFKRHDRTCHCLCHVPKAALTLETMRALRRRRRRSTIALPWRIGGTNLTRSLRDLFGFGTLSIDTEIHAMQADTGWCLLSYDGSRLRRSSRSGLSWLIVITLLRRLLGLCLHATNNVCIWMEKCCILKRGIHSQSLMGIKVAWISDVAAWRSLFSCDRFDYFH